ncbi:metal ABC transporter substrate-binding protein [Nocardioides sp.]|uniref:metal ABC transporter substrate-binding protein n=1 Tax=Nocardioides sp. TaxID=35761 RepID=UPI003528B18F
MKISPTATRFASLALLGVLASSLLAACGDDSGSSDTSGPSVAAAFYPLAYVAERVAGDHATVENLTQPGGEPHDLELGLNQTVALQKADVVVYEAGFQPAVDDAVADLSGEQLVDAASVVQLHPAVASDADHAEDHEDGELDPHFWQDPLLLADVADAVADSLSKADPDHADDYAANAAALRTDLEQLDQDYTQGLTDCERSTVVVSHDAFEYLTRYGLTFEPIAGLSPDAEPSPAGLAALQKLARTEGVTTVFSERLASPALADTLAHDLGISTGVLDPIEGLSDETADEDYLSLMRENLAALQKANGC